MNKIILVILVVVLTSSSAYACGSCGSAEESRMCQKNANQASAEEGTLKAVMQQLAHDFAVLNQAVLVKDFSSAASAAHRIADHETPSMMEKMKIMSGMGTEMSSFKKEDEKVHQLAIWVEKAAIAQDMPNLIKHQSNMLSACMGCHTLYRDKVMSILK